MRAVAADRRRLVRATIAAHNVSSTNGLANASETRGVGVDPDGYPTNVMTARSPGDGGYSWGMYVGYRAASDTPAYDLGGLRARLYWWVRIAPTSALLDAVALHVDYIRNDAQMGTRLAPMMQLRPQWTLYVSEPRVMNPSLPAHTHRFGVPGRPGMAVEYSPPYVEVLP